jgi:uncharacterized protein (TIGR02099 family)
MPLRRSLRFARHGLFRGTAVLLILAASLVGILRLSLPWLTEQPALLAQVLGEALKTRVSLVSAQSRWEGSGPVLSLNQLELGEPDSAERMQIQHGDVRVDLFGFLPGRRWVRELSISGLTLTVERKSGRWGVSGLPLPKADADQGALLRWLDRLGAVRLRDVQLVLVDHDTNWRLRPPRGDVLLGRSGATARLGLQLGGPGAGSMQVVLAPQADMKSGRGWIGLEAVDLSAWRDRLEGSMPRPWHGLLSGGIWFDWADGRLEQGQLDLQLDKVSLSAGSPFLLADVGLLQPQGALPDGRVLAQSWWDGELQRLSVDWEDEDGRAPLIDAHRNSRDDSAEVRVADIALEPLAALLPLLDLPDGSRAALYQLHLRGRIAHLRWVRPAQGDWWAEAQLSGLASSSQPRRWPALEGLDLELSADPHGLWARVIGAPPVLQWTGAWPEPVTLESLQASVAWVDDDVDGRQLLVEGLRLQYHGADVSARARISLPPGGPPVLQLEARAQGALEPSREFWVRNRMSPKAVAWLERALDNGILDQAAFFYRGAPRDWPFAQAQGRLELDARGSALHLDYHEAWPAAEIAHARARIVNRSLYIDQVEGVVSGVPARASGRIGSFREPVLELSIEGGGDAADMLQLLRQSPLEHRHGSLLLGMEVAGRIDTSLSLSVPLKPDLGVPVLDGLARIRDLSFHDLKWNTRLTDVQGSASYSLQGFVADDLRVRFRQSPPVRLDLALGGRYSGDPALQFRARMDGVLEAQDLFADHAETLGPILRQLEGSSRWQGQLEVREQTPTRLLLESDLVGTAVTLPLPLSKPAQLAAPLRLTLDIPSDQPAGLDLRIGAGLPLTLAAQLPRQQQPFRAQLKLGAGEASLPEAAGLAIDGKVEGVDLGAWAGWLAARSAGSGLGLNLGSIQLQTSSVALLGAVSLAEGLEYQSLADGGWRAELRSEAVSGTLALDHRGGAPALSAQFERLHLPDASEAGGQGGSIDPRALPALHFSAQDLRVGKAVLGQTRIEAYPTDDGLRFEQLEARSAELTLVGSGLWSVDRNGVIGSSFQLRFSAEDLGLMLTGLGFAAPVEGGQTLASIDARWAGPPTAFGLERLQGTMDITVGSGRLLDLSPGAGRVFGLLSLRALPRRLALDFRDVFETGLAFDSIGGSFDFQEGNAWTTNLIVRGPAADITIIGRTGLALRDYDQEVAVQPRMGSAFPVVGAIAGGPAGAAAGLIMQGMLGRGLDDANSYLYNVTGTWEDPSVERVERPSASRRRAEG